MRPEFLIAAIAAALFVAPCVAQHRSTGPSSSESPPIGNDPDVGVNQLKKFGTYDVFRERVKQQKSGTKSIAELLAQDKADATALVATAKLQCTVTEAVLVAVDDKAHTRTFEIACQNAGGYFLVESDPPAKPSGFSCFAADATRQADIAAHREPAIACGLPGNANVKAVVQSILTQAGKSCVIGETSWRGQSATTDFLEVSCTGTPGFMVRSPLPGSLASPHVDTCEESAARGLACRLAGNDTTLLALKAALAAHNISCDAEAARVIGHETVKKREVVEYLCPRQQPKGLVVFLPGEGSTAPFEAIDCAAAAKRNAVCTLTK